MSSRLVSENSGGPRRNYRATPQSCLSTLVRVARDKLALQCMSFSGLGVKSHGPLGGWAQRNQGIASRWSPEL